MLYILTRDFCKKCVNAIRHAHLKAESLCDVTEAVTFSKDTQEVYGRKVEDPVLIFL